MKKLLLLLIILFVAKILSAQNIDTLQFTQWINKNSIDLNNQTGLNQLADVLKDKAVVGLGECVHGSKTINNLRFDVAKALIEKGDFNIVAFEMPFNIGLQVNHFLQTGEENIEQILKKGHFFTNSSEMLEFIKWIKQHNAHADKPVTFYGFDIQSDIDLVEDLLKSYRKIDKESENLTATLVEIFSNNNIWSFGNYSASLQDSVMKTISCLRKKHELNRKDYILNAGFVEYEYAGKRIDVLTNLLQMINSGYGQSLIMRDSCNAELVKWIKGFEGEKSKVILFVHNGHLGKSLWFYPRVSTMSTQGFYEYFTQEFSSGYYLRETFSEQYFFVATQFGSGYFMGFDPENDYRLSKLEVTPPEPNTLPYLLQQAGKSPYFIDLRSEPRSWFIIQYLCSLQSFYNIGAAYDSKYYKARLIEYFDAIIYIDSIEESNLFESEE